MLNCGNIKWTFKVKVANIRSKVGKLHNTNKYRIQVNSASSTFLTYLLTIIVFYYIPKLIYDATFQPFSKPTYLYRVILIINAEVMYVCVCV